MNDCSTSVYDCREKAPHWDSSETFSYDSKYTAFWGEPDGMYNCKHPLGPAYTHEKVRHVPIVLQSRFFGVCQVFALLSVSGL